MQTQQPAFERLLATLDKLIAEIAESKLSQTAALLKIARLDLLARVNGVSEDDLEMFLSALEYEQRVTVLRADQVPSGRRRREMAHSQRRN